MKQRSNIRVVLLSSTKVVYELVIESKKIPGSETLAHCPWPQVAGSVPVARWPVTENAVHFSVVSFSLLDASLVLASFHIYFIDITSDRIPLIPLQQ